MTLRQDYESSASKLKALEKQVKALRQEKDEIHKVPGQRFDPCHKNYRGGMSNG